jgi:hypothetical protein
MHIICCSRVCFSISKTFIQMLSGTSAYVYHTLFNGAVWARIALLSGCENEVGSESVVYINLYAFLCKSKQRCLWYLKEVMSWTLHDVTRYRQCPHSSSHTVYSFTTSNFVTVLTVFFHLQLDLSRKWSFHCSLLHFVCDRLIYFLSLHFAPFYWSVMCG